MVHIVFGKEGGGGSSFGYRVLKFAMGCDFILFALFCLCLSVVN